MAKNLVLKNLRKEFSDLVAVNDVNLEIKEGEFVCLLGPSGCGKTTILRMVTGFEFPTSGTISFDGVVINQFPPQKREFGIVFQSYALFPNMNVFENLAFGLKMRKMPRDLIKKRVEEILDMLGLLPWKKNYPAQLSGGQQQRVALGRALAPNPNVLLLDEPLSALDAKIRLHLRAVIKQIQYELGVTMIYVTHDQEEALSMADRIVVMNQGDIMQIGGPQEIYKAPSCKFVANFVGISNFFQGEIREQRLFYGDKELLTNNLGPVSTMTSGRVDFAIRPEKVEILYGERDDREKKNILAGRVTLVTFLGSIVRLLVQIEDDEVIVDIEDRDFEKRPLKLGDEVLLYFPPSDFLVFPEDE